MNKFLQILSQLLYFLPTFYIVYEQTNCYRNIIQDSSLWLGGAIFLTLFYSLILLKKVSFSKDEEMKKKFNKLEKMIPWINAFFLAYYTFYTKKITGGQDHFNLSIITPTLLLILVSTVGLDFLLSFGQSLEIGKNRDID